jgi:Flp pilus assembly protein TadB
VTIGAVAIGIAVALVVIAGRGSSVVDRRLGRLVPARPIVAGFGRIDDRQVLARIAGGLCGCIIGCVIAVALGIGPLAIPMTAYGGAIAPAILHDRRIAQRRREADRAFVTLIEWLHALVASGRPIEAAIVHGVAHGTGSALLDASLDRVRRDYTLGVPLRDALAREGTASRSPGLIALADRLDRARDLGRGMLPVLQDLRDQLRASERAAALRSASLVEGKLTLVLTLCYLPALALLVIVPLFLTLLAGLFG